MNLFIKFDGHKMQSYRQNVNNLDDFRQGSRRTSHKARRGGTEAEDL